MVKRSRLNKNGSKARASRLGRITKSEVNDVVYELALAIRRNPSLKDVLLDELDISDAYFDAILTKVREIVGK